MAKAVMPSMMPAPPSSGMLLADRSMGYPAAGRKIKTGHRGEDAATAEAGGTASTQAQVKLTIREFRIKESRAAAAIQQALEAELPKLERCCQEAAKTGVKLPGEITVTFTIGLNGKITGDPKFTMTAKQKSLENCLAAALKGIQFSPPLPAAVSVTVKFALTGK